MTSCKSLSTALTDILVETEAKPCPIPTGTNAQHSIRFDQGRVFKIYDVEFLVESMFSNLRINISGQPAARASRWQKHFEFVIPPGLFPIPPFAIIRSARRHKTSHGEISTEVEFYDQSQRAGSNNFRGKKEITSMDYDISF